MLRVKTPAKCLPIIIFIYTLFDQMLRMFTVFLLQSTKQLFHPVSGQCMDCDAERREIYMSRCDASVETQRWQFEKMNVTEIRQEWASS